VLQAGSTNRWYPGRALVDYGNRYQLEKRSGPKMKAHGVFTCHGARNFY
jgi:hypothetical protein